MGWVKLRGGLTDEERLHLCGLAFTSDSIQFDAASSLHTIQAPRESISSVSWELLWITQCGFTVQLELTSGIFSTGTVMV